MGSRALDWTAGAARLSALALVAAVFLGPGAAWAAVHVEGDLPRQADLMFRTGESDGRLMIMAVAPSSRAEHAGLRIGDQILAINARRFDKPYVGDSLLERADGDRRLTLTILRDGRERGIAFVPASKPLEHLEGLDSYHGVIEVPDGSRLRSIITRPAGSSGKLPAIFMVQWVSCDSVEFTRPGAWLDVYRGVAQRSGLAMLRVERAPTGDSDGPACHEFDYDTELAHYRHALDQFMSSPHVDADRIIVMGNSLGTTMAPLVAQGKKIAGITVASGGALTYLERMVYFDRQALERSGGNPADIHPRLIEQMRFHVEYLLNGKTPEQIAAENPPLGRVWKQIPHTGDGVHYGRPYAYHHQAAQKNLLGAWAAIDAPVLVLFNSFDQYESRKGAEVIAEVVNRLRPNSARFVELPMLEHSFYLYPSADSAYTRERGRGTAAPEPAIHAILSWLRSIGVTEQN